MIVLNNLLFLAFQHNLNSLEMLLNLEEHAGNLLGHELLLLLGLLQLELDVLDPGLNGQLLQIYQE